MTMFGMEIGLTELVVGLLVSAFALLIALVGMGFTIAAVRSRKPAVTTNAPQQAGNSSTSVQKRIGPTVKLTLWILAAIAVFMLAKEKITPLEMINFWSTTPLGEWLDQYWKGLSLMLWPVSIIIFLLLVNLIVKLVTGIMTPRKKEFRAVPFGDTVAVIVTVLTVGGLLLLLGGGIFIESFDDELMEYVKANKRQYTCHKNKDLRQSIEGGRQVVVCPENGPLYLYAVKGHRLEQPVFHDAFREDNRQVLENWKVEDFIRFNRPGTFNGSISGSHRISPILSQRHGPRSAFTRSGLDQVVLYVKAVKQ